METVNEIIAELMKSKLAGASFKKLKSIRNKLITAEVVRKFREEEPERTAGMSNKQVREAIGFVALIGTVMKGE